MSVEEHRAYNGFTKDKEKVLIIAHPDDETIFFGGLILRHPHLFHIICVTDANADSRGHERKVEFENACNALGALSFEMLDFPDIYEKRLDIDRLQKLLQEKVEALNICEIFTHGPIGEYGHPHHQDVSYAVHSAFAQKEIYSPAYNNYPDVTLTLSSDEFKQKAKILNEIYGKETQRFLNLIPTSFSEGYSKISLEEAESIYRFLTGSSQSLSLSAYADMEDFIRLHLKNKKRLF